jgi:hypothetical protein
MGYIIPYYDEDKNGTATGYCYGIPPSAKTLASALIKDNVSQACRPPNIPHLIPSPAMLLVL